jgi:peptide/nickel transport system substrate-binding protein
MKAVRSDGGDRRSRRGDGPYGTRPTSSGLRFKGRVIAACLVSVGVALTAAACGGGSGSSGSGGGASTDSSITIVLPQEPRSLASWAASVTDGEPVVYNVEEPLVTRNASTYSLEPDLATSWKQVSPTKWEFDLRHGVSFTDGTPLTATAAAQDLNYLWSAKNNFANLQFMGPQITAKAVSTYVLDVTTAQPDPILPARMFFSPLMSPKLIGSANFNSTPIGTGPYKFVKWARGQSIQLTENQSWWGLKGQTAFDKPTIQNVTFTFNTDSASAAAAVAAGNAQLAAFVEPQECQPQCITSATANVIFLMLDASTYAPLKDVRVREAIALAINKQQFVDQLLPHGVVASQLVGVGTVGYNSSLQPYPYDPTKAKQLIAQAKTAGVPVQDPLHLIARSDAPTGSSQMIQVVQSELQAVGFSTTVTVEDKSQLETGLRIHPKQPPANRGWVLLYIHGNPLFDLSATADSYYTCASVTGAYCNPALDKLANAALSLSGSARQQAYAAVAKYIYDNYIVIPIGEPADYYAAASNLQFSARRDEQILVNTMHYK